METLPVTVKLIVAATPLWITILVYIIQLERKLARICTDIQWIKKRME